MKYSNLERKNALQQTAIKAKILFPGKTWMQIKRAEKKTPVLAMFLADILWLKFLADILLILLFVFSVDWIYHCIFGPL